jgi:PAP2 superfamily
MMPNIIREAHDATSYPYAGKRSRPIAKRMLATAFIFAVSSTAMAEQLGFKGDVTEALGQKYSSSNLPVETPEAHTPRPGAESIKRLFYWSQIATNSEKIDHTPVAPGETRVFGEQFGPARSGRALAIVHIAIFDAVNAVTGGYKSYAGVPHVQVDTSVDAAIAQAAHDALIAVYPSQRPRLDILLAEDLGHIGNPHAKASGILLGQQAAAAILAMRADDGSQRAEPKVGSEFITSNQPGKWRPDPVSQNPLALGAYWGSVKPFVLQSGSQFRIPAPPALTSPAYTQAYEMSQRLGGNTAGTGRTPEQTIIGTYWAYDGVPNLGAPPRLYNQITAHIVKQYSKDSLIEHARLLALINVAVADAGIAAWESKYYYMVWRPVGGIRESDAGTGPTGLGDGNPATIGDPNFVPLGAPADNLVGPDFTPPFPSYPSGHATLGGALFQTLRMYYGKDTLPFTFVSDEYDGVTRDNHGNVRPLIPRSFTSLTQAEEENGMSRIYLGVHWLFDATEGIKLGHKVADYVFKHAFLPQ